MAFIYKTKNLINGKIYIGKSKYNKPEYFGSGLRIAGAIEKYGKENFVKEIIEECNDSVVNEREIFWITHYNSTDDITGYNISRGVEGGAHYWSTLTEEQRIEHNRKISSSRIGQKMSPRSKETKEKQSKSFREHAEHNPNFFKERALAKCKWYLCVDHSTNAMYRTKNLKEFCKEHNLNFEAMRHNARTRKNYCNGTWSCSMNLYNDTAPATIVEQLINEINNNNIEYRNKIRQAKLNRKTNGNL